jgi:hypothetical protein
MVLSLFLLNFGAAWVHPRCGAPFLRHRSQRCDNRKRKVSVFRGAHVSIDQQQLSVIKTSCTRKMNDLEAVLLRAFR